MAMVCDVCGAKFARDDGQSTVRVTPFRPDFKLIQALAATGKPYDYREPLELDLCLPCTMKMLLHLGLPTEICELPQLPPEPSEPPSAGALTDEDLRTLGLLEREIPAGK